MSDIYSDGSGSKKKFLVPLVVMLLCTVSLTGAGFAYNSTVTNTANTVHVEGITLDLKTVADEPAAVTSAMYNLNFAYGSHTTQGQAVKYVSSTNMYGFYTDTTTTTATTVENVDGDHALMDFNDGFYVDTMYSTTSTYSSSVGYHADATYTTSTSLTQAAADGGKGVYAVGSSYTLTVTNESGTGVGLDCDVTFDSTPTLGDGVKAIYLVVKGTIAGVENGSAAVSVDKVINLLTVSSEVHLADFAGDQSASTNFTVSAYVVCSDYYSASAPAVTDANYGFVINFAAATA